MGSPTELNFADCPSDDAMVHLEQARAKIICCLGKLDEAATFFGTNSFQSIEDAVDEYWLLFVPEGIQERESANKTIEEEVLDLEVAYLGHLMMSNGDAFLQRM